MSSGVFETFRKSVGTGGIDGVTFEKLFKNKKCKQR